MRLLVLLFLLVAPLSHAHDLPVPSTVPAAKWRQVRPDASMGYGSIVDDLESMTKGGHPMRNASDPGNWVHELTHQVNSDMRGHSSRSQQQEYNSFYILNQLAVSLPEPNVTLKQVADAVPQAQRGGAFQLYLVQQRRYWNEQPLYVLDEATASGNALLYQIVNGKPDNHRLGLSREWANYSQALLRTVEQFDPNYSALPQLQAFIQWHNARLKHLDADYQKDVR